MDHNTQQAIAEMQARLHKAACRETRKAYRRKNYVTDGVACATKIDDVIFNTRNK